MDAPDADPALLQDSLVFIRRINVLLRYTRATIAHLDRFTKNWDHDRRLTILDVATGSGDIPVAILEWASRRKISVHVVGIDLHEDTLRAASRMARHPDFCLARADATNLPFETGSFDFVLTNMFLHHLDEHVAVRVLQEMDRVARTGVIAADLLRSRRAYFWISLFTLFSNPMVRHDARVSVSGAFDEVELLTVRDKAGLGYLRPVRHFGHRLVLAGRKLLPSG